MAQLRQNRQEALGSLSGRGPFIMVLALALVLGLSRSARPAEGDGRFFDAAPFARVCTWDPRRDVGVRANRLEEIAADDLFLAKDLMPGLEGDYSVEPAANGEACIGLEWIEARPLTRLQIRLKTAPARPVRIQFWQGETVWQGRWVSIDGAMDANGSIWAFTPAKAGALYWKVRWIVPAGGQSVAVTGFEAITSSTITASDLLIQSDPARPGQKAEIEVYNGSIIGIEGTQRSWDMGSPLQLAVRHVACEALRQVRADRTMIRFRVPGGAFAVAIDDVLERGPVYVPHAGLFVSRFPAAPSLDEYKRQIADKRTVLERVRAMPDQTRERAMKVTHCDPRLDAGRMMLSLACDNAEFVTEANGTVFFFENFDSDEKGHRPNYTLTPMFGDRRVLGQSQAWGLLGLDKAAHADPAAALALRINEKDFARGLGHHASGDIVIDVSEGYAGFEAEVGLQWQGGKAPGSVVFQVLVDGQKRFDSGVMRERDDPKRVNVPLIGARMLALRLADANDGIGFDAGNWCDARLIRADAAEPVYLTELFTPTPRFKRHLQGGWLPAPVTVVNIGGIEYRQRTYVAPLEGENLPTAPRWLNAKPCGVLELTMTNHKPEPADASASFVLATDPGRGGPPVCKTTGQRTTIIADGRLVGVFDSTGFPSGTGRSDNGHFSISGRLPANGSARCCFYLPAWKAKSEGEAELGGGDELFGRFKAYWEAIMAPAMQIELPDAWLADVIRANQVHVLLAARNEQQGRQVEPWIASDRYLVAIDSEGNSPIRGMQYWGHFDYAQRAFEYSFSHYKPEGFMTMGYTVMGSGWHLWALGEYMRLARDDAWFRAVADKPAGMCRWVTAQLAKTRRLKPDGRPVPEFGLMPPGVQADWNAYAYYFYANSYFHAGLDAMGHALGLIGHPDADAALAAAAQLGRDVRRAYGQAQALAPVVPLQDGTWVPYYPASVYTPGPMADFYPGQDGNRSWAYDVDLGPHHMVPLGAMRPDAPEVDWIMDHMEDVQFLESGWGGYPADRNRADWFDMGGFAKVQPYYTRNAEICALRDDVKPFVRSYFNTLASLIDGSCLSIYEHFSNWCYNKTHETGYFLHQSRTMLLTERGDELWLAPLVTDNWLEDGMKIRVANAPTFFGPVSYQIASSVGRGHIDAMIDPPTWSAPKAIVLRLRHPEGRPIKSVQLDAGAQATFDNTIEVVRMAPSAGPVRVRVEY
ncbi:MAG TPA: NPCBM/NEW2 domain-containing protein [Candidatus Paceibacterota bacterium]|nr:NPCBM/NEW2 domain-containing protein [Candidatus Paceibacterota bacterium]HRZ54862.1 NPCBM/NEW2 domain-containing protein [Candidatus Paceibacterota bacterium]